MTRITTPCVAAALLFAAGPLSAQEEEERQLGWADEAEVSFVSTGGNSEAQTLGLRNRLSYTWERARFTFDAAALRASAGTIRRSAVGTSASDFTVEQDSDSELTAENYLLRGRFDRRLTERLFWYGGGGWDRNVFAGIESRYEVIGGVGNDWLDEEGARFRTTYGISYVHQEDVIQNDAVNENFAAARLSSDYLRTIGNAEYGNVSVVNLNLRESSDMRFDMVNEVSVALNAHLAMKVSHQLLFDNLPSLEELALVRVDRLPLGVNVLVPLEKFDSILNVSLVVTF